MLFRHVAFFVAILAIGIGVFMLVAGMSFVDALYFTVARAAPHARRAEFGCDCAPPAHRGVGRLLPPAAAAAQAPRPPQLTALRCPLSCAALRRRAAPRRSAPSPRAL